MRGFGCFALFASIHQQNRQQHRRIGHGLYVVPDVAGQVDQVAPFQAYAAALFTLADGIRISSLDGHPDGGGDL